LILSLSLARALVLLAGAGRMQPVGQVALAGLADCRAWARELFAGR